MRILLGRLARLVAPALAGSLLLTACATPTGDRAATAGRPAPAGTPWLYKGSDIPVDPAWLFGELPNGLRYAVRRNGVPPGQVSIRVRIDAGSLNETESERGFAHFIEHLSFRKSTYVPDGEAIRIWQRLGATFGADSNASTTPTQTVYKLDLPSATRAGLDESVRILSGMMTGPAIEPAIVDSERFVILAEAREQSDAGRRLSDATRGLFFAGQRLADRPPIGTTETLTAATADTLRAFHDRWYRPERAVVVITGDGDPRLFEALIRQHFSAWAGDGRNPRDTDFGEPRDGLPKSAVLVEPRLPTLVNMATLRPWRPKDDTIVYNQGKLRDLVALQIINRQLESRARAGGAFLQASVDRSDISRSVDATTVSIVPLGEDWRAAVREVRSVIAEALATPPDQALIDREVGEFDTALAVSVENSASEPGGRLADEIVEAVDIRETVASSQVALDIFRSMQGSFTPAAMQESTRRLFDGVDTRAMLSIATPDPEAETQLAAAFSEEIKPEAATRREQAAISIDQLPALGTPATVTLREAAVGIPIQYLTLSNGVRLVLFPNTSEAGKINIVARFGGGSLALPADQPSAAWAGPLALVESGIGPFGQDDLDRLTSGRRINLGFTVGEDRFELRAVTRAADLRDQLRLMAAKLANPSWEPNPVTRARAISIASYDASMGAPLSVLARALPGFLRGDDPRYTAPDRAQIQALDPAGFRALWEPLLSTGPIELMIFGDMNAEEAIRFASETFGALPPRADVAPNATPIRLPAPSATPTRLTHRGSAEQAAALVAWPTGGGIADIAEARRLELLAAIFNDRLFDRLRQLEGASYSPTVLSTWPERLAAGGAFVALSAVSTDRTDDFFRLTDAIAAELISTPVAPDELQRAIGPMVNQFLRASTSNSFWIERLAGVSWDRNRLTTVLGTPAQYQAVTPAELQASAVRWLRPATRVSAVVEAEGS